MRERPQRALWLLTVAVCAGCVASKEAPAPAPAPPPPSKKDSKAEAPGPPAAAPKHVGELPPVYNALFEPTFKSKSHHLVDRKPTKVRFFIGPLNRRNAISSKNWTVSPDLLKETQNIGLIVTMTCPFCATPRTQTRPLTYVGAKKASNEAVFTFTPLLSKINDLNGVGQIGFQISQNGRQVDYVVVNVLVRAQAEQQQDGGSVDDVMAFLDVGDQRLLQFPKKARLHPPEWSRDVDLTIAVRVNGYSIEVQLQPNDPALVTKLPRKYLDQHGSLRWLKTGLKANEVSSLLGRFYLKLYATVNNDAKLRTSLAGSPAATGPATGDVLLSDRDEKALLDVLGATGGLLYSTLFVTGADPSLRSMMESIRRYSRDDRAVRVRIDADGIYLPWQVLVPPGERKADEYWGFRYELSVNPTGDVLPGPYEGPLAYQQGPMLFGRYRGTSPDDVVAKLGRMEMDVLKSELHIVGIVPVDSRDIFLQKVRSSKADIRMLMTFTHARSGTVIRDDGTVAEDVAGPRVQFAADEYLPARELAELLASLPESESPLFRNHPVVFLNGCETGTGGFFATSNQDFAGTFLRLGARGVIVTEAPIWSFFGYNFGVSLLRELTKGTPIPAALLKARLDYLKTHNPLGLLYSYYGGADVTISF